MHTNCLGYALRENPAKQFAAKHTPKCYTAIISGMRVTRNMKGIIHSAENAKAFTFQKPVRSIADGAFKSVPSLRQVALNEGLEVLGADEPAEDNDRYLGVFEESAIGEVRLRPRCGESNAARFRPASV